ncbi:MAG: aminoacyl-tRNA hydrolase [Oligoflexia bacterium]|nr:aminoacyl-tRNA hydrolase [Oligoflexia bacterium]
MLSVTPELQIPLSEIAFSYARSSGPGGQNVNKVNSKAILRWNLRESPSVREELRARLLMKLTSRLSEEGELVLASDRFRDQPRNREDCLEKLRELLAVAATVPKNRRKTRPTRSSKRKKRELKENLSRKKNLRGRVRGFD